MSLDEYKEKRDLKESLEPKGKVESSKGKKNIFVIHSHFARSHHYDLRLEIKGVLKSWAVPKEPPKVKGIKRLAIQTEDHPLDYANFEGEIPEGHYGAGIVKIWDKGEFELIGPKGVSSGEKDKEKIEFKLKGKKMKGNFVLVKTNYGSKPEKSWLFMKI